MIANAGVMNVPFGPHRRRLRDADRHQSPRPFRADQPAAAPRITDRVVTVASGAHHYGKIRLDDLNWEKGYRRHAAYGQAKLANVLFMAEISAASTRPARACARSARTPAGPRPTCRARSGNRIEDALMSVGNRLFAQNGEMGAEPTLYAATQDIPGNSYVGPDGRFEMRGHPTSRAQQGGRDPVTARKLWELSERLTGVGFPREVTTAVYGRDRRGYSLGEIPAFGRARPGPRRAAGARRGRRARGPRGRPRRLPRGRWTTPDAGARCWRRSAAARRSPAARREGTRSTPRLTSAAPSRRAGASQPTPHRGAARDVARCATTSTRSGATRPTRPPSTGVFAHPRRGRRARSRRPAREDERFLLRLESPSACSCSRSRSAPARAPRSRRAPGRLAEQHAAILDRSARGSSRSTARAGSCTPTRRPRASPRGRTSSAPIVAAGTRRRPQRRAGRRSAGRATRGRSSAPTARARSSTTRRARARRGRDRGRDRVFRDVSERARAARRERAEHAAGASWRRRRASPRPRTGSRARSAGAGAGSSAAVWLVDGSVLRMTSMWSPHGRLLDAIREVGRRHG